MIIRLVGFMSGQALQPVKKGKDESEKAETDRSRENEATNKNGFKVVIFR